MKEDYEFCVALLERVRTAIAENKLIERGDHIVIGLSGGPDSVCLFLILTRLKEELAVRDIVCVHVNHMLREGDAELDEAFCAALCEENGVAFKSVGFDCEAEARRLGITCEEAGRQKRYEAFDEAAAELGGNVKIAVAHNFCDRAETVLLRILRGTGVDGLAAIEYKRKSPAGFDIVRPILDIDRRDIERFCRTVGVTPRIDKTNLLPIYTRNRLRLELMPYLAENFNPNIEGSLVRLAASASEDKDFMGRQAEKAYAEAVLSEGGGRIEMSLPALRELHPAIRKRVVMTAMAGCGLKRDITRAHIAAADSLIRNGATGKTAEFPSGYRLSVAYDIVVAAAPREKRENPALRLRVTMASAAEYARLRGKLREDGAIYAAFDAEKLREGGAKPELRTRRAGDWMAVKKTDGTLGRKKLQDLFVDMKLPRETREELPLIAAGSEILFISTHHLAPAKYTPAYRITPDSENIVILEISKDLC